MKLLDLEEINKIVDIVMTDQDVWDALNDRILTQQLENLKKKKAFEDGEKAGEKKGEKRGEKIGEKKGERKGKIEIAKEMIKKGYEIQEIIDITGLKQEDIDEI